MSTVIVKDDEVIFTKEILAATLDPHGNTPFKESDVGDIFYAGEIHEENADIGGTLHNGKGTFTRHLPMILVLNGRRQYLRRELKRIEQAIRRINPEGRKPPPGKVNCDDCPFIPSAYKKTNVGERIPLAPCHVTLSGEKFICHE